MAKNKEIELQNKLVIFQSTEIRRLWHEEEWFYSVVDICGALTDSSNPRDYWYRVKKRLDDEEKSEPLKRWLAQPPLFPSSKISSDNIVNYSAKPTHRVDMVFGVGYNNVMCKKTYEKNTEILNEF